MNFTAVLVAALIPMLLGFIWYNPKVFGNAWMQATGMTEEKAKSVNLPLVLGLSFLCSLLLAVGMDIIAYHDGFVKGALFYATNGTLEVDPASEAGKWWAHFQANYSSDCRTFKHGAFHGAVIGGVMILLPTLTTNALYERRGFKYIAINAGFWILNLALMGGLIAAWK